MPPVMHISSLLGNYLQILEKEKEKEVNMATWQLHSPSLKF